MARMLGPWLADQLAQPVIIENRPGAGGNLAVEAVAKSAPDGYTLLQIASPNVINSLLYTKLNFNFIRDIAPAASFMQVPGVMVINPSFPSAHGPHLWLCESAPGRGRHGVGWERDGPTDVWRVVQDDERHSHAARSLPWLSASSH